VGDPDGEDARTFHAAQLHAVFACRDGSRDSRNPRAGAADCPNLQHSYESMSGRGYSMFMNDRGVPEVRIGVREFKCIGVSPPQDHPHV
jgi:hypothetical protein